MELPGKCIKCLAEDKLKNCIREFLRGEDGTELRNKFETLLSFLTSPDLRELTNEAERLLSKGKEVKVKLYWEDGSLRYELRAR